MKLFGRMSIYGEYLTSVTPALIAMSNLHLTTDEHEEKCHSYDSKVDTVAELLRQRGFATKSNLRGNLPLGYGFAGSTVLAFLHLHDQLSLAETAQIAGECDEVIHGFPPSGIDSMACLRQRSGFYCNGRWTDSDIPRFEYSAVLFPKTISRPLAEINATIGSNDRVLGSIADHLTNRMVDTAELDYDTLLEYCRVLVNLGVYSSVACKLVKACLDQKVVAKGIGGLYEKAVLVIWPEKGSQVKDVAKLVQSFRPTFMFPGISRL